MGGGQSTTSVRKAKFSYVPHSDGLPLFGHSAVVTRGKMLIYGGHNGQSLFNKLFSIDLNNFEIKLLSNVVESSEEELTPVMGHSAIITTDNRMFVFGGFTAPLPLSKFTSKNDPMDDGLHNFEKWAGVKPVTNALYMFHIDSNCWQKVKVKSLPQNNHMVVRQPTPGGDIFSEAFSTIDNVHIHFETQLMSVPMPRALHAAAFSCHRNEQKMFVVGGLTHLEESSTSEAIYEMNLETYTWRRISFIPESDNPAKMDLRLPLFGHSCVVDSNRLIVIGGRHSLKLFHLVQVLDLDTFQWSFIDLEPSASSLISSFSDRNQPKLFPYFHSAVFDGRVLIYGGFNNLDSNNFVNPDQGLVELDTVRNEASTIPLVANQRKKETSMLTYFNPSAKRERPELLELSPSFETVAMLAMHSAVVYDNFVIVLGGLYRLPSANDITINDCLFKISLNNVGIGASFDKSITIDRFIGSGSFSNVYSGWWVTDEKRPSVSKRYSKMDLAVEVAIKKFKSQSLTLTSKEQGEFSREMAIISRMNHQNIVEYKTYCAIPPNICLVLELSRHGDLLHFISRYKVPFGMRVSLAKDIASALTYMHHILCPPVLHRDLKTSNVLIFGDVNRPIAKISDFGLSKLKRNTTSLSVICGTPEFMAPEQFLDVGEQNVSTASDVFSLGMVLYQLFTGEKILFPNYELPIDISRAIVSGLRPRLPSPYDALQVQTILAVDNNFSFKQKLQFLSPPLEMVIPLQTLENNEPENQGISVQQIKQQLKLFMIEEWVDFRRLFIFSTILQCWREDPSLRPSVQRVCSTLHQCFEPYRTIQLPCTNIPSNLINKGLVYSCAHRHSWGNIYVTDGSFNVYRLSLGENEILKWDQVFTERKCGGDSNDNDDVDHIARGHISVLFQDRWIYMFDSQSRHYVHCFDIYRQSWKHDIPCNGGTDIPVPSCGHSVVKDENRILVFGGQKHFGNETNQDLFEFDMESLEWRRIRHFGDIPSLSGHSAAIVEKENKKLMYIFGGRSEVKMRNLSNEIYALDLDTYEWKHNKEKKRKHKKPVVVPKGRFGHSCVALGHKLVVVGGNTLESQSSHHANKYWVFNTDKRHWKCLENHSMNWVDNPPTEIFMQSVVRVKNTIFMFGGVQHQDDPVSIKPLPLNNIQVLQIVN